MAKMNAGQRRVSLQIRRLCNAHAYKSGYGFKLIDTGLIDSYGRHIAICLRGVVVAMGHGCFVESWSEYPTRTLQRFLRNAIKQVNRRAGK